MTKRFLFAVFLHVCYFTYAIAADLPANIDGALQQLIVNETKSRLATPAGATAPFLHVTAHEMRDDQQRVLVTARLNGLVSLVAIKGEFVAAGATVNSANASYRHGILSAYVPVSKMAALARTPGVMSMSLGHRPRRNIGAATSGGVYVLHTDLLNSQGLDGTGLKVGVLSDSYDTATETEFGDPLTVHAANDVASGDLPGVGNPNGYTTPVNVVEDGVFALVGPTFDEGRAMLQIVHDIAPAAHLAFATAYPDLVTYANNIRRLRTEAECDVIVDDIIYTEEPFFSDGVVAQAVNDVAFSDVLPGPKVLYFSAAGNQQGGGYLTNFQPVPDAAARAGLPGQNVQLSVVPSSLTTGGFHNFNPAASETADISQSFPIFAQSSVEIDLQWNDPFDKPGGVTTDYNLLIFDADGNFLASLSGTDDNTSTQEAIEDVTIDNPTDNDTYFQIVISRKGDPSSPPVAQKLRYLALDSFGDGAGAMEYYQPKAPATFGRSCAAGAIGVGAYVYDGFPSNPPGPPFTPFFEDSSSEGAAYIDFDADGNRLAQTEVRNKPEISAPDGGNSTFFGDDYEGDGLPNFFGTSAAAPHAAAVAALLLQKAGGTGSLSLAAVKTALQNSVLKPHDIDPFYAEANGASRRRKKKGRATLSVSALGNGSNGSSIDPNFFTITFHPGSRRETLAQVTINLRGAGLKFDSTPSYGFAATVGNVRGIRRQQVAISAPRNTESFSTVSVLFAPGSFGRNTSVSFGIDRDFIGDGAGNAADLLEGAEISGVTSMGKSMRGTFTNRYGFGYTIADGFGLIDGQKAANHVP